MSEQQEDALSALAKAKKAVSDELHKQGTPEYDPRTYERLLEAERKAAAEADSAG
jgi:hypothetical protein